jgi:hypothetical protein
MNIERTWWFKSGLSAMAIGTALGLFYMAGWSWGGRSVWGAVILLFCMVGLKGFYAGIFGIVGILVTPSAPRPKQQS